MESSLERIAGPSIRPRRVISNRPSRRLRLPLESQEVAEGGDQAEAQAGVAAVRARGCPCARSGRRSAAGPRRSARPWGWRRASAISPPAAAAEQVTVPPGVPWATALANRLERIRASFSRSVTRVRPSGISRREGDPPGLGLGGDGAPALRGQVAEGHLRDVCTVCSAPLAAGEGEQVDHHGLHPQSDAADLVERAGGRGGVVGPFEGDLGDRAQLGERGPHLVGEVGGEGPLALEGLRPGAPAGRSGDRWWGRARRARPRSPPDRPASRRPSPPAGAPGRRAAARPRATTPFTSTAMPASRPRTPRVRVRCSEARKASRSARSWATTRVTVGLPGGARERRRRRASRPGGDS